MTRDELLACLQSIEWSDIEFKEASWAVPKDALSTVSAFANTAGGHLVFGVKQANGLFAVTGVTDADKVQNDFLGQVRDVNKVSIRLPINGTVHQLPEGTVLAFYIPEATRQQKPVYLDGNPKKAHVRRGGRDDTCTGDELLRFIRDEHDGDAGIVYCLSRKKVEETATWLRSEGIIRREVALVDPAAPLRPNPYEVADIFEVPLRFLLDPAHHERHSYDWNGVQREWFAMPYQDGRRQHYIWGATAGMLRNFYRFMQAPLA